MAFALDAIVNDVTYSLSDGDPFRLESAQGLAMPSVRRLTERGPRQDGDTDLGYRLEPRTITLSLNFYADTYAALDGHRDTLATIFKPARGYDIKLRVTRDDGAVRQIDCHTVGPVDVRLVREERPGKLHRAVVQLRAADPTWYGGKIELENFPLAWWLGGGVIDSDNLRVRVESPAPLTPMGTVSYIADGQPWTFVIHMPWSGTWYDFLTYPFYVHRNIGGGSLDYIFFRHYGTYEIFEPQINFGTFTYSTLIQPGDHVYILSSNGGTISLYRDNVLIETAVAATGFGPDEGDEGYWGSNSEFTDVWPEDIPHSAVYDIELNEDQRAGLQTYLLSSYQVVYAGDWPAYPEITIGGPISDFVITNETTGKTLDFTGVTVNAGEQLEINLRPDQKSVIGTMGTVSIAALATGDYDSFSIAPDPIAAGGTNVISVTQGTAGTLAYIQARFMPHYLSY